MLASACPNGKLKNDFLCTLLVHCFQKTNLKQGAHVCPPMIRLPCACCGRTAVCFPANSSHMCCVELALKGVLCFRLESKGSLRHGFPRSLTNGYVMLMIPNKGERAVHSCHCPLDMAVCMLEGLARRSCGLVPLALIYW